MFCDLSPEKFPMIFWVGFFYYYLKGIKVPESEERAILSNVAVFFAMTDLC